MLLQIIGIALFAAGIVVKFDLLQKYLQPLIDEILPEIPSLAVGASVNDPQSMTGRFPPQPPGGVLTISQYDRETAGDDCWMNALHGRVLLVHFWTGIA